MKPYRQRKPRASPLWQCLSRHFAAFLAGYERHFQPRYGFLRPIIPEVVDKFLDCGDLSHGFDRVRCDHCHHEYLLAFTDHCFPRRLKNSVKYIFIRFSSPLCPFLSLRDISGRFTVLHFLTQRLAHTHY